MAIKNNCLKLALLGASLSLGLSWLASILTPNLAPARAEEATRSEITDDILEIRFQSPPGQGDPGPSSDGGTRTGEGLGAQCPQEDSPPELPMTMLLPETKMGLTVSEHPTFFVYVPATQAKMGEFAIADEHDLYDVYYTSFPLPKEPGIVRLTVPETAEPLELGKNYKWYFVIVCDPIDRMANRSVSGFIKRTEPLANLPNTNISDSSAKRSLLERSRFYAKHGIWHETLTNLAELRLSQAQDPMLEKIWSGFLQSVGVDAKIASQPIIECCSDREEANSSQATW